jgi:hypothetical protein
MFILTLLLCRADESNIPAIPRHGFPWTYRSAGERHFGFEPRADKFAKRSSLWVSSIFKHTPGFGRDARENLKDGFGVPESGWPHWAQLSTLSSDAFATGQALYALHTLGMLPVLHS